jgi:hypothetical protein
VDWVARNGWKLLPHYKFTESTGQWRHRAGRIDPAMRLTDVTWANGRMEYRSRHATEPESALRGYVADADRILAEAVAAYASGPPPCETASETGFEGLRWFPLPGEAWAEVTGRPTPPRRFALHPRS